MTLYVSLILVPYSFFILYQLADTIVDEYSWARVHGPNWNTVFKVPANGIARWDRWGEVAAGYITFILFGTGTDANNTYKELLTSVGFGKIFPSLYTMCESSGIQTPTSVTFVKHWTSNWSRKAKSLISKSESISRASYNASLVDSNTQPAFTSEAVATEAPGRQYHDTPLKNPLSFFGLSFGRRAINHPILPLHRKTSNETVCLSVLENTPQDPSAFTARAWAADDASGEKTKETTGVHIVREVHQASQEKGKDKKIGEDAWM